MRNLIDHASNESFGFELFDNGEMELFDVTNPQAERITMPFFDIPVLHGLVQKTYSEAKARPSKQHWIKAENDGYLIIIGSDEARIYDVKDKPHKVRRYQDGSMSVEFPEGTNIEQIIVPFEVFTHLQGFIERMARKYAKGLESSATIETKEVKEDSNERETARVS